MNNLNTAPMGLRFIAFLIDVVILFLLTVKIPEKGNFSLFWDESTITFELILWIVYFVFLQSWFSGTIGKRLVGIKMISDVNGSRPTYIQCLNRTLVRYFSMWSFMYGYYTMFLNNTPKTWHDEFANTIVVKS